MNNEADLPQLQSITLARGVFCGDGSLYQETTNSQRHYKNTLTMKSRNDSILIPQIFPLCLNSLEMETTLFMLV